MRLVFSVLLFTLLGCTDRSGNVPPPGDQLAKNPFAGINNIMVGTVDRTEETLSSYDQQSAIDTCVNEFRNAGLTAFSFAEKNRDDPRRSASCHFLITTFIQKITGNDQVIVVTICTLSTTATTVYGASGFFEMYTDPQIITVNGESEINIAIQDTCKDSIGNILRYRSMK